MRSKIKSFIKISTLVVLLILAISLIKSTLKIIGSNQKLSDAQHSVNELEIEHKNLIKQLNAIKSAQFVESTARDKLGLAKKGEIVVVLPDEASLKSLAPKVKEDSFSLPIPIWQKWLKLFL